MKTTIALAASILSLGIAGITPTAAYTLSPPGPFVADGTTSATKSSVGLTLNCNAHFTGTVNDDGTGSITGGSFTDNGGIGCTAVTLSNLPWKVLAINKSRVRIYKVKFSTPIGNCGPGNVPAPLTKRGVLSFTAVPLPPDCSISGTLTTTPKVTIVP